MTANDPAMPVMLYATMANRQEAETIGRDLVERRLVACANIIDGVASIYRWQGKICEDREAVMICKTLAWRVPEVKERLKALHSYDCPCLVAVPIVDALPAYLEWLREQTSPG